MPIITGGGGGSGGVTSVTAADGSVVVGGTGSAPTIRSGNPLAKLTVPVAPGVNNTPVGLSYSVPGGTVGANGILRITFAMSVTGSLGNFTITLALGGTTIKATTATQASAPTYIGKIMMIAQNATNSQLWHYAASSGSTVWWTGSLPIASAKDMTQAQTLALTVQSTDVIDGDPVLQFVTVELLSP